MRLLSFCKMAESGQPVCNETETQSLEIHSLTHCVSSTGGGLCGTRCTVNHLDFEILTPPYLFNADGTLATRPSIQSSPASVKAGDVATVTMNTDSSHTFSLIKLSAITHSVNNDQRRVPLAQVSRNGSTFSLKIPDNKNVALAGYYFLFAMNANGVPSVGTTIRIDL
jgi:galactose oxidase